MSLEYKRLQAQSGRQFDPFDLPWRLSVTLERACKPFSVGEGIAAT